MRPQIWFFLFIVIVGLFYLNYSNLDVLVNEKVTSTTATEQTKPGLIDNKIETQKQTDVKYQPIPAEVIIKTPILKPTLIPTIILTPELPPTVLIVDEIGMHNKQINNILNHTDYNITKFIDKIEVYYSTDKLNIYCGDKAYGCTNGKDIAIISMQMFQARNDVCSGDTCYYYKGSFAKTLIHEIGHIEGINLYNNYSETYADNYSKIHYISELEFSFDAEKIYIDSLQAGYNKDNKHLSEY